MSKVNCRAKYNSPSHDVLSKDYAKKARDKAIIKTPYGEDEPSTKTTYK